MKKILASAALLLFVAYAQPAQAISIFSSSVRATTVDEVADDAALAGQEVWSFFVTTDADILQFDSISTPGLYQHALGDDDAAPSPAFVAVFPSLGADSYLTTPGGTAIAGGGFGDAGAAWFDTSDDGAQINFPFAQLTVPAGTMQPGAFSGRIQTRGSTGPVIESFSLPIPEPATLVLAGLSLIGVFAGRRR